MNEAPNAPTAAEAGDERRAIRIRLREATQGVSRAELLDLLVIAEQKLLAARQEVEATRAALLAIADAQRYWEVGGDDDDETFQEFAARLQSLARTGLANRLRAALAATQEEK